MAKTLVRFWLRRFALVFIVACASLYLVEVIQHGQHWFGYVSVLGWSAATASFASSLATYWAYKIQCKQVFK